MFVNISNHPSAKWDTRQRALALALAQGEYILDVPFPEVPANASCADIYHMARRLAATVPDEACYAMVQGEFTLTFSVIKELQARGITCVAATSRRFVTLSIDGVKESRFEFVQFREFA